ncbi:hypothetical protein [Streptomyces olivaceoviridis]
MTDAVRTVEYEAGPGGTPEYSFSSAEGHRPPGSWAGRRSGPRA